MLVVTVSLEAAPDANNEKRLSLDKDFYLQLYKAQPIIRDCFMEESLNRIVISRGVIKSISKFKRYKRNYRVVLIDKEAAKYNLIVLYYLFIDNEDTVAMLKEDVNFEFIGQLVAYTPVNTLRNSYILDVILESGAIVIE